MISGKYNIIAIALILSALLHGFVLLYQNKDEGGESQQQRASVTVQLELVASVSEMPQQQQIKVQAGEEVLAVRHNRVSRSNKARATQQVAPLEIDNQSVSETEVVADYSDKQISKVDHDKGERSEQLKKYVYEAINREKNYPYIARKQRREGQVRLDFILHPDGQVTDVLIVQSSRYTVLDEAAKKAVKAISPFLLAAKYLNMQHHYNVGIEFRLN